MDAFRKYILGWHKLCNYLQNNFFFTIIFLSTNTHLNLFSNKCPYSKYLILTIDYYVF